MSHIMDSKSEEFKSEINNFYGDTKQAKDEYKIQLMQVLQNNGFNSFEDATHIYPFLSSKSSNNINLSEYNGPSTMYKYMLQALEEDKYDIFCNLIKTYHMVTHELEDLNAKQICVVTSSLLQKVCNDPTYSKNRYILPILELYEFVDYEDDYNYNTNIIPSTPVLIIAVLNNNIDALQIILKNGICGSRPWFAINQKYRYMKNDVYDVCVVENNFTCFKLLYDNNLKSRFIFYNENNNKIFKSYYDPLMDHTYNIMKNYPCQNYDLFINYLVDCDMEDTKFLYEHGLSIITKFNVFPLLVIQKILIYIIMNKKPINVVSYHNECISYSYPYRFNYLMNLIYNMKHNIQHTILEVIEGEAQLDRM